MNIHLQLIIQLIIINLKIITRIVIITYLIKNIVKSTPPPHNNNNIFEGNTNKVSPNTLLVE